MSPSEIKEIIRKPGYDPDAALKRHLERLEKSRDRLNGLIESLKTTLSHRKGETVMTDSQKFEALKQQKVDENEENFGKEIREVYGEVAVENQTKDS